MTQQDKANQFAALHVKGTPLVLYNIWDAGTAAAIVAGGAPAVATGSWSVAGAQGAADGQALPLEDALRTARQIVAAVDVPVSIDFEGGYGDTAVAVAENVAALMDTGAVGLNFEDQVIGGAGLHDITAQAAKITAIRTMASARTMSLFINARTDVFLKASDRAEHPALQSAAIERGLAYAEAGASGFFIPGAVNVDVIAAICEAVPLPVNVMHLPGAADTATLAQAGVSRISHGPGLYRAAMAAMKDAARSIYGG